MNYGFYDMIESQFAITKHPNMSSYILHWETPKPTESKERYKRRIEALIGARDVELVASARNGDKHIVHCIFVSNPGSLRTLNASQKHRIANAHGLHRLARPATS